MAQLESLKDAPLIRDRIYDMLRSEILSGGFAPGDDLNILSISKQLGVSCAPVREALNMLNKDGLIAGLEERLDRLKKEDDAHEKQSAA